MKSHVVSLFLCLLLAGCAAPPRKPPAVPPPVKSLTAPRTPIRTAGKPYNYLPDDWPARTLRIWKPDDDLRVAWKCEEGLWAQRLLPGWGWIWCNHMATEQTTNGWCVYKGAPCFGYGFFRLWSETNTHFTNAMTISVEMLQTP